MNALNEENAAGGCCESREKIFAPKIRKSKLDQVRSIRNLKSQSASTEVKPF